MEIGLIICPPTSFSDHRTSASEKICSYPQKDFFNSIGPKQTWRDYASALLFVQSSIGFIRRRLAFGALGFAQRSFLVPLSLFLLAPSTCRPRSLGSISSVIWLKCHRLPRWLITHLSALYKHLAMPAAPCVRIKFITTGESRPHGDTARTNRRLHTPRCSADEPAA